MVFARTGTGHSHPDSMQMYRPFLSPSELDVKTGVLGAEHGMNVVDRSNNIVINIVSPWATYDMKARVMSHECTQLQYMKCPMEFGSELI